MGRGDGVIGGAEVELPGLGIGRVRRIVGEEEARVHVDPLGILVHRAIS